MALFDQNFGLPPAPGGGLGPQRVQAPPSAGIVNYVANTNPGGALAGGIHAGPPPAAAPRLPYGGYNNPTAPGPTAGANSPFSGDPGYAGAQSAENLGQSSLNAQLNAQIAARIAAYGDPGLAEMAGFGLDPQAAAFAKQNYLSGNAELARIDNAHKTSQRNIINTLAAHGLLQSGETGYDTGQESQAYGNNVYDAQQRALADILGYRQATQSQLSNLHSQTLAALENAYQNYTQNPALYGTGAGQNAVLPPAPPASPKSVPRQALQKALQQALKAPPASKKPAPKVNAYNTGQKKTG